MVTYYAVARNDRDQIAQVRVTVEPGQRSTQAWTGVVYRTEREAKADLIRLNCPQEG